MSRDDKILRRALKEYKTRLVVKTNQDFVSRKYEVEFCVHQDDRSREITITCERLTGDLQALQDTERSAVSRLQETIRQQRNEIHRLECIVGMLRQTSTVPNAEEIADSVLIMKPQ